MPRNNDGDMPVYRDDNQLIVDGETLKTEIDLASVFEYVARQQMRIHELEMEVRGLRRQAADDLFDLPAEVDSGTISVVPNIGKLLFKIFELKHENRSLNNRIAMLLFNKNYDHADDEDGGGE